MVCYGNEETERLLGALIQCKQCGSSVVHAMLTLGQCLDGVELLLSVKAPTLEVDLGQRLDHSWGN